MENSSEANGQTPEDSKKIASGHAGIEGPQQPATAINPAELAEAMRFLGFALRAASNYDPSQPDHGRASVVAALVGVNQLIAALFPNEPALPVALIELACALKDLDRGTVAPLLKHTEVGHRPPNALSDELFKAIPAAAMTLQMKAGKSRDDAAGDIANRLNRMGYRHPSGDRLEGSQVAKWRDKMTTERAAENLAVARYQLALQQVKGMDPAQGVTLLLANIPALYPLKIPQKPPS